MKPRLIALGLAGAFVTTFVTAAAFVACGSSPATSPGAPETGAPEVMKQRDQGTTMFDVSSGDTGTPPSDAHGLDVHVREGGGRDVADAGNPMAIDGGKLAACTPITGQCDLVSHNCSAGSECVPVQAADGSVTTACELDQPSERLPAGTACCPSLTSNPCAPNLECNGGNSCLADASSPGPGLPPGWGGSRCSPHCCPSDAGATMANCGTAGDGGAAGSCNLTIVDNHDNSLYTICTYPQLCEPLGILPCPSGFACFIASANGTADCTIIFNPNGDAGLAAGQACQGNDCADGLECIITGADGGATCLWYCDIAGQTTPFDAGRIKPTPGFGGCPSGNTCEGLQMAPAWLGVCAPP